MSYSDDHTGVIVLLCVVVPAVVAMLWVIAYAFVLDHRDRVEIDRVRRRSERHMPPAKSRRRASACASVPA